jgi:hypothetical protein
MKNDKSKNTNLKLWREVEVTDPSWLKAATINGNKIKAINPQKQLKQATEVFGPYGSTWGLRNCKRSIIEMEQTVKLIFLECTFFFPEGEFEISNMIKLCYTSAKGRYIVDDEAPKKVETNTISKALSKLGFASDVFEGRFEEAGYEKLVKYSQSTEISKAEIDSAKKALQNSTDAEKLSKLWNSKPVWQQNREIFDCFKDTLQTLQQLKQ